jgi:hypothetical protein
LAAKPVAAAFVPIERQGPNVPPAEFAAASSVKFFIKNLPDIANTFAHSDIFITFLARSCRKGSD